MAPQSVLLSRNMTNWWNLSLSANNPQGFPFWFVYWFVWKYNRDNCSQRNDVCWIPTLGNSSARVCVAIWRSHFSAVEFGCLNRLHYLAGDIPRSFSNLTYWGSNSGSNSGWISGSNSGRNSGSNSGRNSDSTSSYVMWVITGGVMDCQIHFCNHFCSEARPAPNYGGISNPLLFLLFPE